MAFWRRKPPPGLLHHSDRGSQYASREYRQHLAVMGMDQSMSRKGNCRDNSPIERFFRSLKHEQLNYEKFKTQEAAKWEPDRLFGFLQRPPFALNIGLSIPDQIRAGIL